MTKQYRFAETPMDIRELFMGLFPSYDHDRYNEHEMMAMVWACALAGKTVIEAAIVSNGLLLEAALSAVRRDKEASTKDG